MLPHVASLKRVRILDVLTQHTLGMEKGTVHRDCPTHDRGVMARVTVEHRDDHVLELVVHHSTLLDQIGRRILVTDTPAGNSFYTSTNHQEC